MGVIYTNSPMTHAVEGININKKYIYKINTLNIKSRYYYWTYYNTLYFRSNVSFFNNFFWMLWLRCCRGILMVRTLEYSFRLKYITIFVYIYYASWYSNGELHIVYINSEAFNKRPVDIISIEFIYTIVAVFYFFFLTSTFENGQSIQTA